MVHLGDDRVAYFRNQLVWLKAHGGSMVMSGKKDHMQIKMVSMEVKSQVSRSVRSLTMLLTDNK